MKKKPTNKFISYLAKFHLVTFLVFVSAGVIAGLLLLGSVLNSAYSATAPEDGGSLNTTFDEATIRELDRFETSANNSGDQGLSSGRINPFSD
jgi:hypothetical protein